MSSFLRRICRAAPFSGGESGLVSVGYAGWGYNKLLQWHRIEGCSRRWSQYEHLFVAAPPLLEMGWGGGMGKGKVVVLLGTGRPELELKEFEEESQRFYWPIDLCETPLVNPKS